MTAINENGQMYFTFETALDMSNGFIEQAQLLQSQILELMRERTSKHDELSFREIHILSDKIDDLFKQKELLYKEANKYLKMSHELFQKAIF